MDDCDRGEGQCGKMVQNSQPPKEQVFDFGRRRAGEDGLEVGARAEAPGFSTANQQALDRRIGLFLLLPLASLDRMALKKEVDRIGRQ